MRGRQTDAVRSWVCGGGGVVVDVAALAESRAARRRRVEVAQPVEPRFGVHRPRDAVVEVGLGVDQRATTVETVVATAEETVLDVDGAAAAARVVVDVVGSGLVAEVEQCGGFDGDVRGWLGVDALGSARWEPLKTTWAADQQNELVTVGVTEEAARFMKMRSPL